MSAISWLVGQMSLSITGLPSVAMPIGVVVMSSRTVPLIA